MTTNINNINNINNISYNKYINHIDNVKEDAIIGEDIFSDIDVSSSSLLNIHRDIYSHKLEESSKEIPTRGPKKKCLKDLCIIL
jgi:hypothetical protein